MRADRHFFTTVRLHLYDKNHEYDMIHDKGDFDGKNEKENEKNN